MGNKEEQQYFYDMFDEMWPKNENENINVDLNSELEKLERTRITEALASVDGNQTKAARCLNIGRVTLIQKMKKYSFI